MVMAVTKMSRLTSSFRRWSSSASMNFSVDCTLSLRICSRCTRWSTCSPPWSTRSTRGTVCCQRRPGSRKDRRQIAKGS